MDVPAKLLKLRIEKEGEKALNATVQAMPNQSAKYSWGSSVLSRTRRDTGPAPNCMAIRAFGPTRATRKAIGIR
jgi:hypothetical protein